MTRNVLPQIALQAAKAVQGPASELGRAAAVSVDTYGMTTPWALLSRLKIPVEVEK
jgi:hypothetical protein